jgi:hypothetical protein
MYVKPNIHTELTAEQAGLLIHVIDQFVARSADTVSMNDVVELGTVANNLSIKLNFADEAYSC